MVLAIYYKKSAWQNFEKKYKWSLLKFCGGNIVFDKLVARYTEKTQPKYVNKREDQRKQLILTD